MTDKTNLLGRALIERIEAGHYAGGAAIPSERALMAEFGVSRTTVRRAVERLVQRGLLVSRMGSGTYVRGPDSAETHVGSRALILIVPTFADPHYGEMVDGLEAEARRHRLKVIVSQSDYQPADETRQLTAAAADPMVQGAIVVPGSVAEPSLGAIRFVATGKPLVHLGRWPCGIVADGVRTDYRQAARVATDHLLDLGHRRIAYIEGAPALPGFRPFDGYGDALAAAALRVDPGLVRVLDLPSEQAGTRGVAGLIGQGIAFTAILARSDVVAMGVLRELARAGLQVPRDVAIASINNSLLARSVDPPLTSASPPTDFLGRTAVRLLVDRVEGISTGPPIRVTVGTTLIVRDSTAARMD